MSDLHNYNKTLQNAVATGVGSKLTVRQLLDGLLNQVAGIVVSTAPSKGELEQAVEMARHDLDIKVAEYDRRTGYPTLGGRQQPPSPDSPAPEGVGG